MCADRFVFVPGKYNVVRQRLHLAFDPKNLYLFNSRTVPTLSIRPQS
jgi:hypothetical protein